RQPDEGDGNAVELPDGIRRKQAFSRALLDRRGGEVAEFRAREGMRALAAVDRMATAILHAQQLALSLVEFVVSHRSNLEPHQRQRLDGRLVMEQRRQEGA